MHQSSTNNAAGPIIILLDALHSISAGSERQIYQLIDGLVTKRVPVRLVLLRHTPFSRSLTSFPCSIECLDIASLLSLNCLKRMRKLRAELVKEGCVCVHAWLPESCLLAPLFLKHPRIRIITSRRDMGLIYKGKPAWLYRLLGHRTDRVIGNSQAVISYVGKQEALSTAQRLVIYNGINCQSTLQADVDRTHGFTNSLALKVIMVANIKPIKRQLSAVKACLTLNDQGTECELLLVGEEQDPAYAETLRQCLAAHPHGKQVTLTGSLSEPRHLLTHADVGLLISESEGLSNTLMEYMSAGLGIIATRTGGNPELIEHNRNGQLIPVDDQSELLAALHRYANDPATREAHGAQAKTTLESRFSTQAMVDAHLQEYFARPVNGQVAPC